MISQKRGGTRTTGQPQYSTKSYFKTDTSHKYTCAQDTRYYGIYYGHSTERERERESLLIVVAVRELALSVAPKLARAKDVDSYVFIIPVFSPRTRRLGQLPST